MRPAGEPQDSPPRSMLLRALHFYPDLYYFRAKRQKMCHLECHCPLARRHPAPAAVHRIHRSKEHRA